MNKKAFISALILRGPIESAEVILPTPKQREWNPEDGVPRRPNNPSYMRGWCAVGYTMKRKR